MNDQRSKIDIDNIAKLASLPLTKEEKVTFEKQLSEVLTYISKLNEVDTSKVEPIGHITGLVNVQRPDEPAPSLSQEDALKNAPKTHNGFFEVPAIFEEQDT
ncbi:Asp-tRNA(Asn)/Glu-tRNA(Gln) amidotransferase subunit GatC [Candidatus Curtissbacteria bacterium]|nr:Asp-tRNA(Asn)/Glu-tRNA(Gln) amidotransferase subunit GatC [Candidatus Curtissbacteria bacterium]